MFQNVVHSSSDIGIMIALGGIYLTIGDRTDAGKLGRTQVISLQLQ